MASSHFLLLLNPRKATLYPNDDSPEGNLGEGSGEERETAERDHRRRGNGEKWDTEQGGFLSGECWDASALRSQSSFRISPSDVQVIDPLPSLCSIV